jgi:hypothetical protein
MCWGEQVQSKQYGVQAEEDYQGSTKGPALVWGGGGGGVRAVEDRLTRIMPSACSTRCVGM